MKKKIKAQKKEHDKLLEDAQKAEEGRLFIQKKFNSAQEEHEETKKILEELRKKYKNLEADMKDQAREFEL